MNNACLLVTVHTVMHRNIDTQTFIDYKHVNMSAAA